MAIPSNNKLKKRRKKSIIIIYEIQDLIISVRFKTNPTEFEQNCIINVNVLSLVSKTIAKAIYTSPRIENYIPTLLPLYYLSNAKLRRKRKTS